MVAAAVIGGVATAGSAAYSAHQARKGAKAQVEAGDRAAALEQQSADKQLALQREIWEQQQKDQAPWLKEGQTGITKLGALMGNGDPFKDYLASKGVSNKFDSSNTRLDSLMKTGSGQLNNPFDTYLASKGVSNKFDSSNTRLDSLMKTGSGQLNNPFDTYLASKGLEGGKFNTNNPQYQFLLKQGQQQLDRNNAASGMGYSGSQLKAAQQFGQGLASQQYDKEYDRAKGEFGDYYRMAGNEYDRANQQYTNEYNRALSEFGDYYRMAGNEYDRANQQYTNEYNRASGEFGDYYNRLASLASGGQQTAQSLGSMGGNYATGASNTLGNLSNARTSILGQQANARASGYAASANAFNQGLGNMIDIYGISKKYG